MLDKLHVEDWQAHLQEDFSLHLSAETAMNLRLTGVTPLSAQGGYSRQPYSLEFSGPLRPVLPQATYRLKNDAMGELDIFLVPVGPSGQAMRYEAVFT
jgi:hypothetical protein